MRRNSVPKYRRQRDKTGDRAFAVVNGVRVYLGRFETSESHERYQCLIGEWRAGHGGTPAPDAVLTVSEVILRYMRFAEDYYRHPDGTPTDEQTGIRLAMRPLRELYSRAVAAEFGPVKLEAVQHRMIADMLSRGVINQRIGRIKRMFKWAARKELIPGGVYPELQTLPGLRAGRTEAKDHPPIQPVPADDVAAIEPHVSSVVWAMVQLQLLTGCRPSEVCGLRLVDIDMSGDVWLAHPRHHKTAHRGHVCEIFVGSRCQEVLQPFMSRPVGAHMFSARESVADLASRHGTHRRPDQRPSPRKTRRIVRDHFDRNGYRRAVERGCKKAGIPTWTPHRLRHSRGTEVRRLFGLEAAQVALGHKHANVTEVYAETNRELGFRVAAEIG